MTNYFWPTWADLISVEIDEYYNYGRSGAGNLYISNSIVEANKIHKFTEDDLIIVMWSSTTREDRYVNRNWETPGNIYTQNVFDEQFVNKWADERFYFLRDFALIELTCTYLENLPCDSYMLQMMPFEEMQYYDSNKDSYYSESHDLIDFYKDTFEKIKPDFLTTEFKGSWPMIKIEGYGGQQYDYHPTPSGHLNYLKKIFNIQPSDKIVDLVKKYEKKIKKYRKISDVFDEWHVETRNKLTGRL